ncbi:transcription antitermination factor NusB [Mobilicoccus pelagius]|uniref:Transcription antitermination protein NusB n=1 Tax=Mobilicoccus pelagius NBRC 104925 TaxID=1089455 RepID=H5UV33_9MICO|nr:transcription antitermination factor NusB [Mobilicoccus pelagius]GAB49591.1 N utilization substance protein B homolog [Mobilicoccus pelagius NBRC 104925]
MSDRLEFSSAPASSTREPQDVDPESTAPVAGREGVTFRDADAHASTDTSDVESPESAHVDDALDDAQDDERDDVSEDEGWSSAPLPVPSSLPEGAVLSDRRPRRHDRGRLTSARSKARKAAVELLYEAEQRGMNAGTLLEERLARPTTQTPLRDYTVACVKGVVDHWAEIDETLETYSRGWRLSRMPAVDRAILRVGTWEILHNDDVPGGVAVSEAVVIAQVLSTDDSPSFVNGLLSRVVEVAG